MGKTENLDNYLINLLIFKFIFYFENKRCVQLTQ